MMKHSDLFLSNETKRNHDFFGFCYRTRNWKMKKGNIEIFMRIIIIIIIIAFATATETGRCVTMFGYLHIFTSS
jgi:hypothetical protein